MESITANLSTKARTVWENGREYRVAPASLIVPGILKGSQGPLYYPPDETERGASAWNGIPITVYHPVDNGTPVSAKSKGVWERQGIGQVRQSTYNGKHVAEIWADVERTKTVDPRVLKALDSGTPIELSTGLFTDNTPAPEGYLDHNGKPWSGLVARNYRPDHLAILPDQIGACSIQDGCGVFNTLVDGLTSNAEDGGEGRWVTMGGTHVFVKGGEIVKGPEALKKLGESRKGKGSGKKVDRDVQKAKEGHAAAKADLEKHEELTKSTIEKVAKGASAAKEHRSAALEAKLEKIRGASKAKQEAITKKYEEKKAKREQEKQARLKARGVTNEQAEALSDNLLAELSANGLLGVNVMGQLKSQVTGWFKKLGAGTGKGPVHEAAQDGGMVLTDEDKQLGAQAYSELQTTGNNPASWVEDESVWERAKGAASKSGKYDEDSDTYWAVTTHIYKNMGGAVKGKADNAFCPTGEGGGVDPSCSPGDSGGGGGGTSSASLKVETEPGHWAGKYKVGDKHFTSKKDAQGYIKSVKSAEKLGKDISGEQWHGMEESQQKVWAEVHLPGYKGSSTTGAPGKTERDVLTKTFVDKLRIADSEAATLRSDGTKKNVFDYWAESAREWENTRSARNQTTNTSIEEESMTREESIKYLTTNCSCWKGKEKVLSNTESFTDADLKALVDGIQEGKRFKLAANAFKEVAVGAGVPETLTFNEMPDALKAAMDKKKKGASEDPGDEDEEEEDDEEEATTNRRNKRRPVVNAKCKDCGGTMKEGKCSECGYTANRRQLSEEEWLAQAPAGVRERDKLAKKLLANEKRKCVQKLVANVSDDERRQALGQKFMAKGLEELEEMVELMPTSNRKDDDDEDSQPFYLGAGSGPTHNRKDDGDNDQDVKDMTPPVTNWEEHRKNLFARAN